MLPSSKKDPAKSKTREKSIKKPSLSGGCLVVAFPVQLLSPFYWIHNSLCFLSGHPDISEVNRLCVKLKIECSLLFFFPFKQCSFCSYPVWTKVADRMTNISATMPAASLKISKHSGKISMICTDHVHFGILDMLELLPLASLLD